MVCVRWSDRRFEDAQAAFVRRLAELGLPVIVVLTQVPSKDGQAHPHAVELSDFITGLGLTDSRRWSTGVDECARGRLHACTGVRTDRLLDATYEVVPKQPKRLSPLLSSWTWSAKKAVKAVINQAVTVASGIGAVPIPFTDAALLVPNRDDDRADLRRLRTSTAALEGDGGGGFAHSDGRGNHGGALRRHESAQVHPRGCDCRIRNLGHGRTSLTRAVGIAWAKVCEYALTLPEGQQQVFWGSGAVLEKFRSALSAS